MSDETFRRWRLVLGKAANTAMEDALDDTAVRQDAALEWLYEGKAEARQGGDGPSALAVPEWLDEIHTLFPTETIERLEKDAVEVYGIDEIVTDPDVLSRIEPNETLLAAVLKTKHLMNQELLGLAREMIRRVVEHLMALLMKDVRSAFSGALDRRRRSPHRVARNLDFRRTLEANLKHYDPKAGHLVVEQPHFFSRTRRASDR